MRDFGATTTPGRPSASSLRRLAWAAVLLFLASLIVAPRGARGNDASATRPPPGNRSAADSPAAIDLEALQLAFQRVVDQVTPSVVGIRAMRCQLTSFGGAGATDVGGAVEQRVLVNGSGTIIDPDGLVLTNEHVVQSAREITVLLHDGSELPATVRASDPRGDLAVLSVPRHGLPAAAMCNWDQVARGQWSIVVGNPFGLGSDGKLSVAVGVVSNLGRQLPGLGEADDRFYHDMIQTTASINPGDSGGPMFNIHGELIGVVTAMHTRAPADEGIGFAIPMTPPKRRMIDALIQGRTIEYGYLGLTAKPLDSKEREALGLPPGQGVAVQQLDADGPASQAGVRVGDVLRSVGDKPVTGPAQLAELVGLMPVGTRVSLELLRDGQRSSIEVGVGRRDAQRVGWMRSGAVLWRGMRVSNLTDDLRRRLHVGEADWGVVVVDVAPDSPAQRAGVKPGDVLEAVGGQTVEDPTDFLLRTREVTGAVEVTIRQRGACHIQP